MQEPVENTGYIASVTGPESKTALLDRNTPLSIEEISLIRSEEVIKMGGWRSRTYQIGDTKLSVTQSPLFIDNFKGDKEHQEQVMTILKDRESGEAYVYERLIVNSLIEQLRIADRFELPQKGLYLHLKLERIGYKNGSMMLSNVGFLYLLPLSRHIDVLRKQGATDDQIIVELAGHIFHEAVHEGTDGLDQALLAGRSAIGELTTVTAQTAYYLDKGYRGPRSYNAQMSKRGLEKIQAGVNLISDYDIVTYLANEFILRSLQETYPVHAKEALGMTVFDACGYIVQQLSSEERQKLLPCLKKAITQSADEDEYHKSIQQLRQTAT